MSEPEPFQTTRYRCTWCRRSWSAKKACAEHIARCWLNPENQSCKTCEHHIEADCEYGYVTDEGCAVGVQFETDEERYNLVVLPLHCPKWEKSKGWAA